MLPRGDHMWALLKFAWWLKTLSTLVDIPWPLIFLLWGTIHLDHLLIIKFDYLDIMLPLCSSLWILDKNKRPCFFFFCWHLSLCRISPSVWSWSDAIGQFLLFLPVLIAYYPGDWCLCKYFDKLYLCPSSSFRASGLTIRFLLHFDVIFVHCAHEDLVLSTFGYTVFLTLFDGDDTIFSILRQPCKESTKDIMTQFWAFFSVSLVAAFLHGLDPGALNRGHKGRKKWQMCGYRIAGICWSRISEGEDPALGEV